MLHYKDETEWVNYSALGSAGFAIMSISAQLRFYFFPFSLATRKVQEPVLRSKDKVNPTPFSLRFACYLYASF